MKREIKTIVCTVSNGNNVTTHTRYVQGVYGIAKIKDNSKSQTGKIKHRFGVYNREGELVDTLTKGEFSVSYF